MTRRLGTWRDMGPAEDQHGHRTVGPQGRAHQAPLPASTSSPPHTGGPGGVWGGVSQGVRGAQHPSVGLPESSHSLCSAACRPPPPGAAEWGAWPSWRTTIRNWGGHGPNRCD